MSRQSENKSKKLTRWVDADDLMYRWHVNELELAELVIKFDLPIYDRETLDYPDNDVNEWITFMISNDDCAFKLDEIEYFESNQKDLLPNIKKKKEELHLNVDTKKASGTERLSPKEVRELGQLRKEKNKWDKSIVAAIETAFFCKDQKIPVTKNQLWNNLEKKKLADIPNTTFEKIWKSIPEAFRSSGGRPKKV